jgi:alpha-D-xyloside xylohydrolase
MAMSGIPWWTTDIGGFFGGDGDDPVFRELLVRWFQYGVFCPLTRLHGDRLPESPMGSAMTGGPNEVWSFGDDVYEILAEYLRMRERLRPYVHAQATHASLTGTPMMRPLLVEFPKDPVSWEVDDQFMFGPDVLVAPVLEHGARERVVYLPAGAEWANAWTGEGLAGGTKVDVAAPLHQIPLFLRNGAAIPVTIG